VIEAFNMSEKLVVSSEQLRYLSTCGFALEKDDKFRNYSLLTTNY